MARYKEHIEKVISKANLVYYHVIKSVTEPIEQDGKIRKLDSEKFITVQWFPQIYGQLFYKLWKLYLVQIREIEKIIHSFYHIIRRNNWFTLKPYRVCRRLNILRDYSDENQTIPRN